MLDMLDSQQPYNAAIDQDPAKYYQMISGFFGVWCVEEKRNGEIKQHARQ